MTVKMRSKIMQSKNWIRSWRSSTYRNWRNRLFWRNLESIWSSPTTKLVKRWDSITINSGFGSNFHGFAKQSKISILKWSKNAFLDQSISCLPFRNLSSLEKYSKLPALLRRARWISSRKRRYRSCHWNIPQKRCSSYSHWKNRRLLTRIVKFQGRKGEINSNLLSRLSTWKQ